jgi:hypothetical protein
VKVGDEYFSHKISRNVQSVFNLGMASWYFYIVIAIVRSPIVIAGSLMLMVLNVIKIPIRTWKGSEVWPGSHMICTL